MKETPLLVLLAETKGARKLAWLWHLEMKFAQKARPLGHWLLEDPFPWRREGPCREIWGELKNQTPSGYVQMLASVNSGSINVKFQGCYLIGNLQADNHMSHLWKKEHHRLKFVPFIGWDMGQFPGWYPEIKPAKWRGFHSDIRWIDFLDLFLEDMGCSCKPTIHTLESMLPSKW